ncbi:hypothetical protein K505DRAFT_330423, partial [Melanomma pulvis-pyrius CBS 109.77]
STGLALGLSSLYFIHRRHLPPKPTLSSASPRHNLNLALFLIHLYFLPSLSGGLYPGALFTDPEFGEGRPQIPGFVGLLAVSWVGWWVAGMGLETGSGAKLE